jgi:uncharacterized protein
MTVMRLLLTAFLVLVTLGAAAQEPPGQVGVWQGSITTPGMALAVIVTLDRKADGVWSGSIDIPVQGLKGLALQKIDVKGTAVSFLIANVPGDPVFEGDLSSDRQSIVGTFSQGGGSYPFKLTRQTAEQAAAAAVRPRRPQEPSRPYPYRDEQVSYQNAKAGITLAGTLTTPVSTTPSPAVVLITGSGAEDRDETVYGHKPFLVLADALTRKGIAVLRVDDRGVGGSGGKVDTSTSEDFAEDTLAGVAYLKTRPDIDAKRIGLIGHSEGGLIAPIAATRSKDVAFIVLMAGPGLTGEQILYLQGAAIMRAGGATEEVIATNRAVQERLFAVLKSEPDNAAAKEKIKAIAPGQERVVTPWFRYFISYDPAPVLKKVTCPVLAINGEKDLQVPYRENLDAIADALRVGGNKDATTLNMPNLNHLFQTSQTGAPAEYPQIAETIAPAALDSIAAWILKRTR